MSRSRARDRSRPSGGAALWTPAQRGAELIAWLDAASSYVTLATGSVAAWLDRSSNARHFSQASAPNRFGYSASDPAYNGRGVLLGTGAGHLDADAAWSIAQPVTVYLVGESGTSGDWKTFIDDKVGATRLLVRADPSEQSSIYAGSANVTATALANTPSIFAAVFNGASSALYVRSTTAGATGNPGTQGLGTPIIGRAAPGPSYYLPTDGKIAEIVIVSGADDATERAQMMRYLSSKFALSVTGL